MTFPEGEIKSSRCFRLPIVIYLWSPENSGSVKGLKSVERIFDDFSTRPFCLFAPSMSGISAQTRKALRSAGVNLPPVRYRLRFAQNFLDDSHWGAKDFPLTVVYDADWRPKYVKAGALNAEELVKAMRAVAIPREDLDGIPWVSPLAALESHPRREWDKVRLKAAALLKGRSFRELDSMAKRLREEASRGPDGEEPIFGLYAGLSKFTHGEEGEAKALRLKEYAERFRDSPTPSIALAMLGLETANEIRKGVYFDAMRPRQRSEYLKVIEGVRESVFATRGLGRRCPGWHAVNIEVAGLGGAQTSEFKEAVRLGLQEFPDSFAVLLNVQWYKRPKWGGSVSEWQKFMGSTVRKDKRPYRCDLYARLALAADEFEFGPGLEHIFDDGGLNWSFVRKGFQDLVDQYPESQLRLNQFAWMATVAKEWRTARPLFEQIGDSPDLEVWGNAVNYTFWRRRANDLRPRYISHAP